MKKKIYKITLLSIASIVSLFSCKPTVSDNKEYYNVTFQEIEGYSFMMKDGSTLPNKVEKGKSLSFFIDLDADQSTNYDVFANNEILTLNNDYYTYVINQDTTFSIIKSYKITASIPEDVSITYVVNDKIVEQPTKGFLEGTELYMQFLFHGYDPESNYKILINNIEVNPVMKNGHEFYYYKVLSDATISITGLERQKFSVTYNTLDGVKLSAPNGSELPTQVEIDSTLQIKMTSTLDYKVGLFVNGTRYYQNENGYFTIENIRSNLNIRVNRIEEGPSIDKNSTTDDVYNFILNMTNSQGQYKVTFSEGYSLHHQNYLYQQYKNEGYISLNRPDKNDGSKALYHFTFDKDNKLKIGGLAIENSQLDPTKYEIITDTGHFDPCLNLKANNTLSKNKFVKNISFGVISEDINIINFFTQLSESSGDSYGRVAISVKDNELTYKLYRFVDQSWETDDYSWGKISDISVAKEDVLDAYLINNPTLGESLTSSQITNLITNNVSVHSNLAIVNIDSKGNIVKSKGMSTDITFNENKFKVVTTYPDYDTSSTRIFENIDGKSKEVGIGGDNLPYYNDDGDWNQYLLPKDINFTSFRKNSDDNIYHYYGEEANKFIFTMSRIGFTNGLPIDDLTLTVENNKATKIVVSYQKETLDGTTSYYEITITFNDAVEEISYNKYEKENNDSDIVKALSYFKDHSFTATYNNVNESIFRELRKTKEASYLKDLTSSGKSISENGYYNSNGNVIPFAYDLSSKSYKASGKSIKDDTINKHVANISSYIFTLQDNTLTIKENVKGISEYFLVGLLPSGIIEDSLKINLDSSTKMPTNATFNLHGNNGDYQCNIEFSNFDTTSLTETELNGLSSLKESNIKTSTWKEGFEKAYNYMVALYGEDLALSIPFVIPGGSVHWGCSGNTSSLTIWFTEANSVLYNPSYLNNFSEALIDAGFTKDGKVYTKDIIKITFPDNPILGYKFEKNI